MQLVTPERMCEEQVEVISILFITWLIILSSFFANNLSLSLQLQSFPSLPSFFTPPFPPLFLIKSPFDMNYGYWSVTTAFPFLPSFQKWSVSQRNHCLHLRLLPLPPLQVHWHRRQFLTNQLPQKLVPLPPFPVTSPFQLVTISLHWSCGTRMTWVVLRYLR